jgi:hypothetical protein
MRECKQGIRLVRSKKEYGVAKIWVITFIHKFRLWEELWQDEGIKLIRDNALKSGNPKQSLETGRKNHGVTEGTEKNLIPP